MGGDILDLAERKPDLAGGKTGGNSLVSSHAAEGIEDNVTREDSAVRAELVRDGDPEFTQTHGSTVAAGALLRCRRQLPVADTRANDNIPAARCGTGML